MERERVMGSGVRTAIGIAALVAAAASARAGSGPVSGGAAPGVATPGAPVACEGRTWPDIPSHCFAPADGRLVQAPR